MTHQGYIASLGTSAMLVASAVAILLIVGTIVAFEGFPGPSVDDSSDAFPVQGFTSEPPAPERVTASPAPPPPAASEAAPVTPTAPAVEVEEAVVEPPAPVLPATPDPPAPPPKQDPPTTSRTGGSPGDDGGGTPTLSKTLTDTTRTLESTVERVLPGTKRVFDALRRLGK